MNGLGDFVRLLQVPLIIVDTEERAVYSNTAVDALMEEWPESFSVSDILKKLTQFTGTPWKYHSIEITEKNFALFSEEKSEGWEAIHLLQQTFFTLPVLALSGQQVVFISPVVLEGSFPGIAPEKIKQLISSAVNQNADHLQSLDLKITGEEISPVFARLHPYPLKSPYISAGIHLFLFQDVTIYRIREMAILSQDRFLEMLVQSANEALVIAQDGKLVYANKHVELLTGYSHDELLSKPLIHFVHPEDREHIKTIHFRRMAGEKDMLQYSFRFMNKTGTSLKVSVRSIPVVWNGRPAGLVFLSDLNEQKIVENALIRAQKLELLGQMTSAVFHDFNNLLTIVLANAEMLEIMIQEEHYRKYISNIIQAAEQSTSVLNQLMHLGRKLPQKYTHFSPNDFILSVKNLFEKTLSAKTVLKIQLDDRVPNIFMDKINFQQILLNLILNARDAMPQGGTILIRTRFAKDISPEVFDGTLQTGDYVILEVEDTGTGIPEDKLPYIFEPFFSTKRSNSMGLGLAIVHNLVKQINGGIQVRSRVNEGTTFTLYFPAFSHVSYDQPLAEAGIVSGNNDSAKILLIEDDDRIREMTRFILQSNGFVIDVASNAETGFSMLQKNSFRYDLIISDIMLTGKSGLDLMEEIHAIHPEIPILLISAYPEVDFWQRIDNKFAFLPKPFGVKDLMKAINELLAGRQTE